MLLLFEHEGYEVITSAWTAAGKPERKVEICYQWGADRLSWVSSATGIRRITLNCTMLEFAAVIRRDNAPIVDCRRWQTP